MHDFKHEIHSRFPVILHRDRSISPGPRIETAQKNTTYRQTPYSRPSDPTAIRTERQRFEDVRPASEAAVNMHRDPPIGRLDALGQGVQGGHHAVELPTPVVAHDDAVASVLDRQQGVFGRQDALDPDLHLRPRLEPGNLPGPVVRVVVEGGEAGLVGPGPDLRRVPFNDGKAEALGEAEVVPLLVVSDAQDGGVGGQEDGGAAGRFGFSDDGFFESAVAHRV